MNHAPKIHPSRKYRPQPAVDLPDRQWPNRRILRPPTWCSVDLRDGNQALENPMDPERKRLMFDMLVAVGFREIEVGFPSASDTEWRFVRSLVESDGAPAGVTVQALTQAKPELIRRTFDSLEGARRAIVHLYNSTSEAQRRLVYGLDREGVKAIAVRGAERVAEEAARRPGTEWVFQYSPESFTGTGLDYALEVCEAVMDVWGPTPARPCVINLPSTVENTTPNIFADRVEWFGRHLSRRGSVVLSVHPHNDRGTGAAAAELALMAGADRLEGTLFGNGERTGNLDLLTIAINMLSEGVDPGLDVSNLDHIQEVYERCTGMPVHPRHPWAGSLVFTAFSGSHQDAIHKGMAARRGSRSEEWEVPYLPIDPRDLGRDYEAVIRINSQSGKGGVAHVMEREFGWELPKPMWPELGGVVKRHCDAVGREVRGAEIWEAFRAEYLVDGPVLLEDWTLERRRVADGAGGSAAAARLWLRGPDGAAELAGEGNGPLDAAARALAPAAAPFAIAHYGEHALGAGSDAEAAAYVQVELEDGGRWFGVGRDRDLATASIRALVGALNRAGAWRPGAAAAAPKMTAAAPARKAEAA